MHGNDLVFKVTVPLPQEAYSVLVLHNKIQNRVKIKKPKKYMHNVEKHTFSK